MNGKNQNKHFISIIIPTYKRPQGLKRLLKSIISQIIKPEEIIIVDDCSNMDLEYEEILNEISGRQLCEECFKTMNGTDIQPIPFLDSRTRLLVITIQTYSVNTNMFTNFKLIAEFAGSGEILTSSQQVSIFIQHFVKIFTKMLKKFKNCEFWKIKVTRRIKR